MIAAVAAAALASASAQPAIPVPSGDSEKSGMFLDGTWAGSVDLGDGSEPIALRLFPSDPETGKRAGGLLDMPARRLFGYPMDTVTRDSEGIEFSLLNGAPFGGLFRLTAKAAEVAAGENFLVSGIARLVPPGAESGGDALAAGPFSLSYSGSDDYWVDTGRGLLPGSILVPAAAEGAAPPIVLILSGADADRDGNNYSVPGRSDALAELALALQGRGIASLRFDKRGSGEAYRLGLDERELRFGDHVEDARAAIRALASDPRFSRVAVLGCGEGALIGAAALVDDIASDRVVGLAALCASGKTELEIVEEALSSTPEAYRAEAEAIMSALKIGESFPNPSPYFADFFRPSIQPYLASQFRYDIRAAFAGARLNPELPVAALVIAGGSDLQVPPAESELLAEARPGAAYRVIPGMSHALKGTGDDDEANYNSFTDPTIPLAEGLVDLAAAFASGEALPDAALAAPQEDDGSGEVLAP